MDLKKNIASFIRAFLKKNNLSMAKFQALTEMSRNSLYDYSRGEGNPSIDTVQYMAAQLGVNPLAILMGVYDPEEGSVSVLLLDTVYGVAELSQEDRQKFFRMFMQEMIKLWDGE